MVSTLPLDYTSKDFDGFRQSMLDYASLVFPEWTGRSRADFGVLLLETFAYMGDILSFYGDRVARESFITTATQRSSLLAHAALLGYVPYGIISSTGTVTFKTDTTQATSVLIPAGTGLATDYVASVDGSIYFETTADVTVPATGGTVVANVVQGQTQGTTAKILNAGATNQANINVIQVGTSDASLDQVFRLPAALVVEGSIRLFVDDTASGNASAILEWVKVPTLLSTSPTDRVFSTSVDDSGSTLVTLGDNVSGLVPATGVRIYAVYRTGVGVKGNIDQNLVKNFVNAVVGVSVSSSTVMAGGSDAESNDSIRANAPVAFQTQDRAVTLKDYASIAIAVPSVGRARASAAGVSAVNVYVVGPGGAVPTPTLLTAVQAALDAKAMVATTVSALAGSKIFVNIGTDALPVKVGVYPHFATSDVQASVESAIAAMFTAANVNLGQRVAVSDVYARAASVPGVAYVVVQMMARSTDAQTAVNDILCRDWEYPVLGTIRVAAESAQV